MGPLFQLKHYMMVVLFFVGGLFLSGCETSRFKTALNQDTENAWLQFLARYPDGEKTAQANEHLEKIRYQIARRIHRPIAYRSYLRQYPKGVHATACKMQLAQINLSQATTPMALELIMERYPNTKEADKAAQRLPELLARQAMANKDEKLCAQFLLKYPAHHKAFDVQKYLAVMRYPNLPEEQVVLENFIQNFQGTEQSQLARKRLEILMAKEVLGLKSRQSFHQFRLRFPQSKLLERLQACVNHQEIAKAIATFDLEQMSNLVEKALAKTGKADQRKIKQLNQILRWCKRRSEICTTIKYEVRRAGIWQPADSEKVLQEQTYAVDLVDAWRAITALGWFSQWTAGDHLFSLVGSQRLSIVWFAEKALKQWLSLQPKENRQKWIRRTIEQGYRSANLDEVQRYAYLYLNHGQKNKGRQLLMDLFAKSDRTLTAGYLLSVHFSGQKYLRHILDPLINSFRARIKWLTDSFPSELHQDSVLAATLAEREMFGINQALNELKLPAREQPVMAQLQGNMREQLIRWYNQILAIDQNFKPAHLPNLEKEIQHHIQARSAALKHLWKKRRPIGSILVNGICQVMPEQSCQKYQANKTNQDVDENPCLKEIGEMK